MEAEEVKVLNEKEENEEEGVEEEEEEPPMWGSRECSICVDDLIDWL